MTNIKAITNIFSEEDMKTILSHENVIKNRRLIEETSKQNVYFSISLDKVIIDKLVSIFDLQCLHNCPEIPMRWAKGDVGEHIDHDGDNELFENTYLIYLTDSIGDFVIDKNSYKIKANVGYVFNNGDIHKIVNTQGDYRLMIGPLNERGNIVGGPVITLNDIIPNSGNAGDTVTINFTNNGFSPGDTFVITGVTFGSVPATVISNDQVSVTCVVPPGTGNVIVSVTATFNSNICYVDNPIPITFTYTYIPISNICFPAKTPIYTDQGIHFIDNLNPSVHTIKNKNIIAITKTVTLDRYLVCFEKHSLGNNYPSQKTIMSRYHKIYYNGSLTEAYKFLHRFDGVTKKQYNGEVLYNVLMEDHNTICVNNLICETLEPTNIVARLYTSQLDNVSKNKIIVLMNKTAIKNQVSSRKTGATRLNMIS